MDSSIFLVQVTGIYFIIVGAVVLLRRKSLMPMVTAVARNRNAQYAIAFVELLAGIALVVAYPTVSFDAAGFLSLFGYMLVIEALFYLAVPAKWARKILSSFNTPMWYGVGGALSVVIGLYMAASGFGFLG